MAWNEPGKGQDPWGGGNRGGKSSGPPDLDELWRKLRKRFSGGGGPGGPAKKPGGGGGVGGPDPKLLLALAPIVAVLWLLFGLFIVQPGEQGVVLRFGDWQRTVGPGWHWQWPWPVGQVITVDVERVRSAANSAVMLTKDENIVDVRVAVQYQVVDPEDYLFSLRDPDQTVEQALKSAVREVVGTSRMNQVIQEGVQPSDLNDAAIENVDLKEPRAEPAPTKHALDALVPELVERIRAQQRSYPEIDERSRALLPVNTRKILQAMLDEYDSGMKITAVNVQYAQPPEPVQPAFEEAIKAREEQERKKNIARAYAREVVARAEGEAASTILEAKGYKQAKIARAEGEATRFVALLEEFESAPIVTRQRLYLESMGEVLGDSNLIMLGTEDSAPLLYLPLQEMLKQRARETAEADAAPPVDADAGEAGSASSPGAAERLRSRERRP